MTNDETNAIQYSLGYQDGFLDAKKLYCKENKIDNSEIAIEEIPKGYIHIDDVFRLIAGHSNYHGNDILSAFVCLSEGKKIINAINPIE